MKRENTPLELSTIEILKVNRLYVSGGTQHFFNLPCKVAQPGKSSARPSYVYGKEM
jgi:hypothetical protein